MDEQIINTHEQYENAKEQLLEDKNPKFSNREIKYHRTVSNKPEKLIITANGPDDPEVGGAPTGYLVTHIQTGKRHAIDFMTLQVEDDLTNEALLAIVKDRLICYQDGPFKCTENAQALTGIEIALESLRNRTINRMRRGVEGMEIP